MIKSPKKLSWAYVSGLIDGEGSITLFPFNRRKGYRSQEYRSILRVGMTYKPLIARLHREFGGGFITVIPKKKHHRPMFYWQMHEPLAARFLKNCLPYLQVKKTQAECLIALSASRIHHLKGRFKSTPPEIVTLRRRLYEKCAKLNLRGAAALG